MIGIHKPVPKEPVYNAVPRSLHEEKPFYLKEKPFHLEEDASEVGVIVKSNDENRDYEGHLHFSNKIDSIVNVIIF